MPGSPPTRTIDPGTIPPPSTKSNSLIPVLRRRPAELLMSRSRGVGATLPPSPMDFWPPARRLDAVAAEVFVAISSTSEFHSPQMSQRPAHLGWSAPQFVQRYTVFAFGLTAGSGGATDSRSGYRSC